MAVLADALAGAREGGHPALLIGGEAGAGKSRLLAEFAATVPEARVLTGGCLLGGDELPFTPFATVLRGLVHELGADAVTAMMPGRGTPELARLMPELGEPDEGRDAGQARARLSAASVVLAGISNGAWFAEHVARHGGGHGWPGGPQFLPARVIGPVPRHLDATGILLEMI
jgi:hypothetical protein